MRAARIETEEERRERRRAYQRAYLARNRERLERSPLRVESFTRNPPRRADPERSRSGGYDGATTPMVWKACNIALAKIRASLAARCRVYSAAEVAAFAAARGLRVARSVEEALR